MLKWTNGLRLRCCIQVFFFFWSDNDSPFQKISVHNWGLLTPIIKGNLKLTTSLAGKCFIEHMYNVAQVRIILMCHQVKPS